MDSRPHNRTHGPRKKTAPFRLWQRPELRLQTTTLWEYPSQHYGTGEQGSKHYVGASPSWVIWNCLQRYTRESDTVLDPMCGSGTTLDVCRDLNRKGLGFDVAPFREDIQQADARKLPLPDGSVDFVFVDPPYSTHLEYSEDPRCIGKLDAATGEYYAAMEQTISEMHRVMKDRRYLALYVSDSFKKGKPFQPIGFQLFGILSKYFKPVDIICVVRHNKSLKKGNWHNAAAEGNFFLRGFNYLFLMKKEDGTAKTSEAPVVAVPRTPGKPKHFASEGRHKNWAPHREKKRAKPVKTIEVKKAPEAPPRAPDGEPPWMPPGRRR